MVTSEQNYFTLKVFGIDMVVVQLALFVQQIMAVPYYLLAFLFSKDQSDTVDSFLLDTIVDQHDDSLGRCCLSNGHAEPGCLLQKFGDHL